ncbi:allantoinase AllB [Catenulispora sp. NF23]|nr:allantoinase AllB [Catenulispora pinistramenti]MBS2532128.1 allantoinase AllB [Catenulispora pinistramenti]
MPPDQNPPGQVNSARRAGAWSADRTGPLDLVIVARRVVSAAGASPGWVGVAEGRLAAVGPWTQPVPASRDVVRLADDEVLIPGLVDSHVHVNEPGRTAWEGFAHAGRAAAAGGVTTIVDMPLNSIPPTTTPEALALKRARAEGVVAVDTGFWGGAVPENLDRLHELTAAGVLGFKCFLADSGVEEFGHLDLAGLTRALTQTRALGVPLLVHAEDPAGLAAAPAPRGRDYRAFVASRPPEAEAAAVAQVAEAAAATGGWAHIVHVSSAPAVEVLRAAKARGVLATAETCPHYLYFSADEVPDGGTEFKCCPPIRSREDREALWRGLADGALDCVTSDHSPCTDDLKLADAGDFGAAWGGISGLQLRLPVLWTAAAERGFTLSDLVRWACQAPARLAGIADRKGGIAEGLDADLVAFAPGAGLTVDTTRLHHRNSLSPYTDRALTGTVRRVWLRGQEMDLDGLAVNPASGLLLGHRRGPVRQ